MLRCLTITSPTSSTTATPVAAADLPSYPASLQGNSREETQTPTSSPQPSPNINLTREYTLAVQTSSYNEIWSKIHVQSDEHETLQVEVLAPNRECVEEALRHARRNTLTRLVSAYFENSEKTSDLCLLLHHSVHRVRALYAPLNDLLEILPLDSNSLNQSQCNWAFDVFVQFDCLDNPFPCPDSNNFDDMRHCFSQLKQQLDRRLRKSRSRFQLLRRATTGSTICFISVAVGVTLSAIAIAAHALVALVASPLFAVCLPPKFSKSELAHVAQLEAAAKGTYVLNNDLDTIDRLVHRLHTAVEGDKLLVRMGLERGRDKHSIHEVVNQLRKNHPNFLHQLKDLDEHICLCFATVNRARSLLLQEIHSHQTCNF